VQLTTSLASLNRVNLNDKWIGEGGIGKLDGVCGWFDTHSRRHWKEGEKEDLLEVFLEFCQQVGLVG
jgi:hypothetical protein